MRGQTEDRDSLEYKWEGRQSSALAVECTFKFLVDGSEELFTFYEEDLLNCGFILFIVRMRIETPLPSESIELGR